MLAMASSFLGFALLEVVGSILIARFVLPGLIRAPGTQSLAQVRDQIAMAAYGLQPPQVRWPQPPRHTPPGGTTTGSRLVSASHCSG